MTIGPGYCAICNESKPDVGWCACAKKQLCTGCFNKHIKPTIENEKARVAAEQAKADLEAVELYDQARAEEYEQYKDDAACEAELEQRISAGEGDPDEG